MGRVTASLHRHTSPSIDGDDAAKAIAREQWWAARLTRAPCLQDRAEIETTTPGETLRKVRDWLRVRNFDALGVASFGPIEPQ